MSALIFRIDSRPGSGGAMSLSLPARDLLEEIAIERVGEKVALGVSDVPGIWTVLATGRLAGLRRGNDEVHLDISELVTLSGPVDVVTAGDRHADAQFSPYALDVLGQEDMARVFGVAEDYQQQSAPRVLAAAESVRANVQGGVLYGGLHLDPQRPRFFQSVASAYQWRCAFTALSQASPDGRYQEGVVIGLDEPYELEDAPPSQGLFVSSSIAFCYRHGLLAIGEDYDILRHRDLSAQMRIILETVNRRALLVLPGNEADWPDLAAARRHRLRFGY